MSIVLLGADEVLGRIANRLRQQRLAQNLPQRELAAMAGVSPGALRTLEKTGHSSMETLVKVAQALGLANELVELFALETNTIAHMEKAQVTAGRQRASRRST